MLGGCLAWTTKAIEERIVEYSSVSEAPSWVAHWLCLLDGLWTCPERNGGGSDLGVEGDFLWRNQRAQVHACIKRSMRRDKASLCSLTKTSIIRIKKKQISKCWKLVIDPLDSHPLSHNISPLQAERLDQAINLQLSARVMQNYNDFVSGMQMVAASVSLLVDGSMGGPWKDMGNIT